MQYWKRLEKMGSYFEALFSYFLHAQRETTPDLSQDNMFLNQYSKSGLLGCKTEVITNAA
jgi:hypothetical protein